MTTTGWITRHTRGECMTCQERPSSRIPQEPANQVSWANRHVKKHPGHSVSVLRIDQNVVTTPKPAT